MLSVSPLIVNLELSASPSPDTSAYVAFWLSRYVFCADIVPTVGTPLATVGLSSTTYHGPRFWLNLEAWTNMSSIAVTEETSHPDMSMLNERALVNIPYMSVTEETSQFDMSPLKFSALVNMLDMSVTEETSQFDMSPLNE